MKHTIFLTLFGALLFLAACTNDSGSDNTTPRYAQTPVMNCNLPGSTNCNPGIYQQAGWTVYPYQYGFQSGFCGCPAGTRPVMSPQHGLGCAPAGVFMGHIYAGWNYQAANNHWTNIPQVTYSPGISGSTGNCYADAARSCSVSQPNSCGAGKICRPVGGATDLGLCTSGTGQETYNHPNCQYTWTYAGWQQHCTYSNWNSWGQNGSGGVPR